MAEMNSITLVQAYPRYTATTGNVLGNARCD